MPIRLVQIDETKHWSPDVAERARKIVGVYVYDDTRRTYCCELTPSRFLRFVGCDLPELPDTMPEEAREDLEDVIRTASRADDPDCYLWASRADAMAHATIDVEEDPEDEDPTALLDRAVAEVCANGGRYNVCPI